MIIHVRSRVHTGIGWGSEWSETVHSWKAAWEIVDEFVDRDEALVWSLDSDDKRRGEWFVDIGGHEEFEDKYRRNPVDLPQDTWVEAGPEELDQLESRSLWHVYEGSYNPVGLQYQSLDALKEGLDVLWLADVDGDPYTDAFIGYKRKRHGNKVTVLATDGSKVAKRAALDKAVELMAQPGWYGEASDRIGEIFLAAGIDPVTDERVVRRVMEGKDIRWLGDGLYERHIPGVGYKAKMLFGRPL